MDQDKVRISNNTEKNRRGNEISMMRLKSMKKKRLQCGAKLWQVLIFVIFPGSAKISSCKKEKSKGNIFFK